MRRGVAFLALAAALFAGGCGSGEEVRPLPEGVQGTTPAETGPAPEPGGQGDPEAGGDVFASAGCGTCHVLADAGTSGTIGPNLDEAQPDHALAVERVTNGMGAMPSFRDQLSEQQIQNVAAYVVQATSG
jgi:mono/diheme cytochrome c family protein